MAVKIVKSGEVLTDARLEAGEIDVYGTAVGTHLLGGALLIANGGVAQLTVIDGGVEQVLAGGQDFGAVVNAGWQVVRGAATNATLNAGASGYGVQCVFGVANASNVNGGLEIVRSGGVSYGARIAAGSERIEAGGSDYGAVVTGGTQVVYGMATGAALSGAGRQLDYGVAKATTVSLGGELVAWGSAQGTALAGGTLKVMRGGGAERTTIDGGLEQVFAGGFDGGAVVNAGRQIVHGVAVGATLNAAASSTAQSPVFGVQEVYGAVYRTTINGGSEIVRKGGASYSGSMTAGLETIASGGVDYGAVLNGGSQIVYGTASGAVINQGATQTVYGTSVNSILHGGQLLAQKHAALSGTVTFNGSGYLLLAAGVQNDAVLALNAGSSATVDLAGLKYSADSHYSLLNGALDVWSGAAHQTVQISGAESLTQISLAADRSGGTLLSLSNA